MASQICILDGAAALVRTTDTIGFGLGPANRHLPPNRSLGPDYTNTIPLDIVDVIIEADGAPFTLPRREPDDIDEAKRLFDGVSITTSALGWAELYAWLDDNADVAFVPVQVATDPTVIAQNHAFVPINGALSVDLYGQAVADNIDRRQISAVGGHEDFVARAEMRLDDCSLTCLRSTALSDGVTRSRIVPTLAEGSVVSTPRHHAGVVITEWGSADRSGPTVRERAPALSDIAHPDFRDGLRSVAATLGRH
jgi:acyl-CoA hydrolase